MQCVRFQRFRHMAVICNMPYRCVKCGQSHEDEVSKCQVPKKEDNIEVIAVELPDGSKTTRKGQPLKCANCNGEQQQTKNEFFVEFSYKYEPRYTKIIILLSVVVRYTSRALQFNLLFLVLKLMLIKLIFS